jgi:high affinity sulfate transporter 1
MPTVRPAWLREYQLGWLRVDIIAGVTVAAYLVPQVMAYAQVAGLPPVAGLWAAAGPLLVYAWLGSSRLLSAGPESSTALMTAITIGPLAAGEPARYAALAAALAMLVGLLCLAGRLARLGFLADLLSRPVLVGYMAGIAVIMIAGQLGRVMGIDVLGDSPLEEIRYALRHMAEADPVTVLLTGGMLVFLLLAHRFAPRLPGPLIAMLLAAAAVALLGLEQYGVTTVGAIPSGLPDPQLPNVTGSDLTHLLLPAVGITIVGYTDNVLTARAFASRRRETVDSNTELLTLGAANLAAGALQGFPVSSSGSRTALADTVGARTQLYSLVALGAVLVTVFFGGPVLSSFPEAALGAVVVYAAVRLIDIADFRRIGRFRRSELLLSLATTASVLVLGVLNGVLVALALSVLDLLRRVARPHDGILGYAPGVPGMHDLDDYPDALQVPGLVVYRYDSPLFFANADDFRRRALAAVDAAPQPVEWLLLNTEANVEIDITAIDALDDMRDELERRGVVLALARVKQDLRDVLAPSGFLDRLGTDHVFFTLPTAVEAYLHWYVARHGSAPKGVVVPPSPTTVLASSNEPEGKEIREEP